MKTSITAKEKYFTKWQETVRKDVERLCRVLKGTWQFLAHPINSRSVDDISGRVHHCLLLHNMCVTDRVMGDVCTRYRADINMEHETIGIAHERTSVHERLATANRDTVISFEKSIGVARADGLVRNFIEQTSVNAKAANLHDLQSLEENARLVNVLTEFLYDTKQG
jgi:hypothetical protein